MVSELAALKAQMAMLMSSNTELAPSVASIWVVYDASKISVWCSKTDCPLLGREVTYDVVKEEESDDGELESIIKTLFLMLKGEPDTHCVYVAKQT